eukprot:11193367-Heterocapsa_arctica.AAC.2
MVRPYEFVMFPNSFWMVGTRDGLGEVANVAMFPSSLDGGNSLWPRRVHSWSQDIVGTAGRR